MSRKSHQYNHQNRNRILALLFLALIAVGIWAAYQGYRYYNAPHIEESRHPLYLTVVTDRNLTLDEVYGNTNDTDTAAKYIIYQKGGLYFFTLSPGLNQSLELEINNKNWYPVDVETNAIGNITQYLKIEVPKPILEARESQVLNLTVSIPLEGALAGRYKGNLTVRLVPKKT
jgi:hypothetical protein